MRSSSNYFDLSFSITVPDYEMLGDELADDEDDDSAFDIDKQFRVSLQRR